MEFSKWVRRHQVTNASGRPGQPLSLKYGVTTSVRPFCMSTTVPYWSNMQTLIFALSASAPLLALCIESLCRFFPVRAVKVLQGKGRQIHTVNAANVDRPSARI